MSRTRPGQDRGDPVTTDALAVADKSCDAGCACWLHEEADRVGDEAHRLAQVVVVDDHDLVDVDKQAG